jgi:hypothetical protein
MLALAMGAVPTVGSSPTNDISTLAGKVAAVNGTAGLGIRLSGFVEEEADAGIVPGTGAGDPITPTNVLTSALDGTSITAPNVTVNRDAAAAPQNETAIAIDPTNPNRVVGAANDYVTRTWTCTVSGTPCSALGDGYSGTYVSNDGGKTWCCVSSDPSHLGTLIPGVDHLAGGQYDAGGDPALAFDSRGNVYYAGLGFDRTAPPNTVAVNRGIFDSSGKLTWSAPTFINQTTSPAILNDKEWIAADSHASSPFRDRVYVSWTRFIFGTSGHGDYVQSPIDFAYSTDGGAHFSAPQNISADVHYGQGSHVVVGPDGTVYVFWAGQTRQATLDSINMVKSTDGGVSWSQPVAVSTIANIPPLFNTAFRVNSYPMADVAPNGDVYVVWTSETDNHATSYAGDPGCAYFLVGTATTYSHCRAAAVYSKSTNGGGTWSPAAPIDAALDASTRAVVGPYPVTQPFGLPATLTAPAARRVDTVFPSVAVSPSGRVYLSTYVGDVVSPWQTCKTPATPTVVGRISCLTLGRYVNNTRLDYFVKDLTTGVGKNVTTHPINTRYGFGGGFFGDYTDIAVGSDNTFHALYTDSNNVQTVVWFYGFQFVPTQIHQQDIATASGNF